MTWSRREFVRLATVGATAGTAGCSALSPSGSTDSDSGAETGQRPARDAEPITGRVVALGGGGIASATVSAIVPGRGVVAETTTDDRGRFEIAGPTGPVWVRATESAFVGRTVAVAPGASPRLRLTPRAGTVALSFGGDVMFGRRFYSSVSARRGSNPRRVARRHSVDRMEQVGGWRQRLRSPPCERVCERRIRHAWPLRGRDFVGRDRVVDRSGGSVV
ncbi:carboxypeptidase-like regulatory domain-containing protein [Halococcoides cellulosivorans]|nr:carboxypeptidase-like regulatory domain-containing protein [Halococcoides cellulosivorans]